MKLGSENETAGMPTVRCRNEHERTRNARVFQNRMDRSHRVSPTYIATRHSEKRSPGEIRHENTRV